MLLDVEWLVLAVVVMVIIIVVCVLACVMLLGVGSVAVLPLNASGRFSQFPLIVGHSRLVTDFVFSPFYDYKLVTGSEDSFVKIWDIPKDDDILTGGCRISNPSLSLGPFDVSFSLCHW